MGRRSEKRCRLFWDIAKANIKHNFRWHFFLAVLLTGMIPVMFGTEQLSETVCAMPLEFVFSLVGILVFTPVFLPEQDPAISQIVGTKAVERCFVEGVRTCYSALALVLLLGIFFLWLKENGCAVSVRLFWGTLGDCIFLGSLGFAAGAFTGNIVISYMIPVFFYTVSYFGKNKMGNFYLFSMMEGDFRPNAWLLGCGCFILAGTLFIRWKHPPRERG